MFADPATPASRPRRRHEPTSGIRSSTALCGRFLQADPIGYGDGMNMYGYVGGDPVNRSDPSGLMSCNTSSAESRICSRGSAGGSYDSVIMLRVISDYDSDGGGSDSNRPCTAPCNVTLPPRYVRDAAAAAVGRSSGSEPGANVYMNTITFQYRYEVGRAAGRGAGGEFAHRTRRQENEVLVLLSHGHRASHEPGALGISQTRANNLPSEFDQAAMYSSRAAVQMVGTAITGTLFRQSGQDMFVVERGRSRGVPFLAGQDITILTNEPQR